MKSISRNFRENDFTKKAFIQSDTTILFRNKRFMLDEIV